MRPTLFDDVQGRENMTQYLKVKETSWLFLRNFFAFTAHHPWICSGNV